MPAKPAGRASITLVEAVLTGLFFLSLAVALFVITGRTREKAEDHLVADQLLAKHRIDVTFDENDLPLRATGRHMELKPGAAELLVQLKPLRYLNLNHCVGVPHLLQSLGQHEGNIAELCLVATDVTDEDMVAVAALPQLRWLDIRLTSVTDSGIRSLRSCDSLVQLDLDESIVTDDVVDAISAITSLQRVSLRLTRLSDEGLVQLAGIRHLRQIDVSGALVHRSTITKVSAERSDLEIINKFPTRISAWVILHVRRDWAHQRLEELGAMLSKQRLTIPVSHGNDAMFYAMYSSTRWLDAEGSQITDAAIPMMLLSGAGRLDLSSTAITWAPETTMPDRALQPQSHLSLAGTQLSDKSLQVSMPFPANVVVLSNTRIGDAGLATFALPNQGQRRYWKELQLDGTLITDASEPALHDILKLRSLRKLNLSRTAISAAVIDRIREAHPKVIISSDAAEQ
jgi:hypothetical protein